MTSFRISSHEGPEITVDKSALARMYARSYCLQRMLDGAEISVDVEGDDGSLAEFIVFEENGVIKARTA